MSTPDRWLDDDELDALLAGASAELLGEAESVADPTKVLLAIMDAPSGPGQAADPDDVTGADVITVIGLRALARSATEALDAVRSPGPLGPLDELPDLADLLTRGDLEGPWTSAIDMSLRFRARGLLDRLPALGAVLQQLRAFTSVLGQARDTQREMRSLNVDAALAKSDRLFAEQDQARDAGRLLVHLLRRVELDARGSDLSNLALGEPSTLASLVWSETTIWPPAVARWIRAESREIQPGVYQVLDIGERSAMHLGR
ncbi:hypothetical protein [Kitasatospora sp. NPDC094015]|uniref:hypothetical protein n=1 Tax=Kitasatospora sp. NPDC094015 TaxID=3155205 RepID=UPI0033258BEB